MKARASSLNPYATSYIPLSRRGPTTTTTDEIKGYYDPPTQNPENHDSLKFKNTCGFGSSSSSSHITEFAGKQALDDVVVDHDMNLAYLQMIFPGVSDESLFSVYTANTADMEATVEMLNQLELHSGDFTENLPDSLDIGDVSEAAAVGPSSSSSSSSLSSQKLKKVVAAAAAAAPK